MVLVWIALNANHEWCVCVTPWPQGARISTKTTGKLHGRVVYHVHAGRMRAPKWSHIISNCMIRHESQSWHPCLSDIVRWNQGVLPGSETTQKVHKLWVSTFLAFVCHCDPVHPDTECNRSFCGRYLQSIGDPYYRNEDFRTDTLVWTTTHLSGDQNYQKHHGSTATIVIVTRERFVPMFPVCTLVHPGTEEAFGNNTARAASSFRYPLHSSPWMNL